MKTVFTRVQSLFSRDIKKKPAEAFICKNLSSETFFNEMTGVIENVENAIPLSSLIDFRDCNEFFSC